MIIDTSAIMALFLNEPEAVAITQALVAAPTRHISGGSWIELAAVVTRHPDCEKLLPRIDAFIAKFAIVIEAVSVDQAMIGHAAYRRYGRGSGDSAQLNLGDCFSYALAKATGQPLLFKGDDFTHTDVVAAL